MDSRGEIREWAIWSENETVFIRHGLLNRSTTKVFERILCESSTDADNQAIRRYNKQRDRKGYTEAIPTCKPFLPMLAQRVQEHMDKIPENVIYQPKLDGYRCLGANSFMKTRTNSPLPSFPHIQKALSYLPDEIVLDGELYQHGSRFQHIMKSRSDLRTADSIAIEYHAFDIVDENLPFKSRRIRLAEVMLDVMDAYEKDPYICQGRPLAFPIHCVQTSAGKFHELENYHTKYKAEGYEGVMVRLPDSVYEIDVRSYGLFKYKKVDQDWYSIFGVEPGPKDKTMGVLVCQTRSGMLFRVNLKGSDTQKKNMLRYPHTVVGKRAMIEYLGLTENGIPRNAVATQII